MSRTPRDVGPRLSTALLIFAICVGPARGAGTDFESVEFASTDDAKTTIRGLVFQPDGAGPFAAVIGVHGCNGLFEGASQPVEHYVFWARQLRNAGYLVLLIDSLGSRGIRSLCGASAAGAPRADREMVGDARGARGYLAQRTDVRASAIALLGWSMGANTVLWTIDGRAARERAARFGAAVVFYPGGCDEVLRDSGWRPSSPLLLQLGAADNYTPAQPCVRLASRVRARGSDEIEVDLYDGAYHLFDHPSMPTHPFTSILFRDGSSPMIGSDPAARARASERVNTYLRTHLLK
jgi:dienelactone hydrolase